jgi:hypothetical protein
VRRLARAYVRLAAHALSALCGFGLALLLGLASPSSLDLVLDPIRTHLRVWVGIAALLLVLLVVALTWIAVVERKSTSGGKRIVRGTVSILRAAVGSTMASVVVRVLTGQDPLPLSGPTMHLVGWLAGHLALTGIQ